MGARVPLLAGVLILGCSGLGVGDETGIPINVPNLVPSVERQQAEAARDAEVDAAVKDVPSFVKWARAERAEKIQSLYKRREGFRSDKGNTKYERERIEATNKEIARINDPALPYVPRVVTNRVITLDELSPTRFLQVIEIVDGKTARVRFVETFTGGKQLEFFLTEIETAGWVDGQKLALEGVLISDGSKSYTTTAGTKRTIAAMRHYKLSHDELTRREDVRTWTGDNGKPVTGALVLYDAGRVTIVDMAGRPSTLKLTELVPADREYVSQHAPTPAPRSILKKAVAPPKADK
jgi:hypothetical protein